MLVPPLESLDDLETRAKTLSAMFRDQAELRDSRVAVTSYLERRWYLTTEGTSVTDTRRAAGVVIAASGQRRRRSDALAVLPALRPHREGSADRRRAQGRVEAARETIVALAKAPRHGALHRSRPVRGRRRRRPHPLHARAAPRRHAGARGPVAAEAKTFGGALTDKVGLAAVAEPLDHRRSDRTRRRRQGADRRLQDRRRRRRRAEGRGRQGRHAEDAALEPHAVGRRARPRTATHAAPPTVARSTAARRTCSSPARAPSPRKALQQKLVAAAKAEGLKYGLVIKRFDDAAITRAPEFSRRELVAMIKRTDQQLPPPAILAYTRLSERQAGARARRAARRGADPRVEGRASASRRRSRRTTSSPRPRASSSCA